LDRDEMAYYIDYINKEGKRIIEIGDNPYILKERLTKYEK
jgi:hypothetical protein